MITNDIMERVFFIKNTQDTASCFGISISWRTFYVTAKHFIESKKTEWWIDIFHEDVWKRMELRNLKHSPNSDISTFTLDWQIDVHPIPTTSNWLIYSQYVYFLWFPYGYHMYHKELNRAFPMPLVKWGIISWMFMLRNWAPFFIDGHNNQWFSGWPVVFRNELTWVLQIAGVISGVIEEKERIKEYKDWLSFQNADLYIELSSWIITAYSIDNAIDLITSI